MRHFMQLFCVHFTIAHCSLCLTGQHEVLVRFSWSILSQYQMVPHYQYTQELSKVENTWNRKFEANASIIIHERYSRHRRTTVYCIKCEKKWKSCVSSSKKWQRLGLNLTMYPYYSTLQNTVVWPFHRFFKTLICLFLQCMSFKLKCTEK